MRIPGLESRPDEELVAGYVDRGDRNALEVLLRRHERRIFGLALRMLGNRADALDATQDALVNVFRRASSFKGEAAFTTWLHRLTINACNDAARKRSRAPEPREEIEPEPGGPAGNQMPTDERLGVEDALRRLPLEQRAVVVMRDLYGLSYQEIAAATGAPEGTVKSRIARGRFALAGLLRADDPALGRPGRPGTEPEAARSPSKRKQP